MNNFDHIDRKTKILVTGGAGFIGSNLVARLNELGFENILISDFLGTGDKYKNLVGLKFDDYIEADELLKKVYPLMEARYVFHLGACSDTTEKNVKYLIGNNYEYTKILAAESLRTSADFIYASSAATYGDGKNGMEDNCDISTLRPLNAYGYSKHLFDLYAKNNGWTDKITGLKYFNIFGPNEFHKKHMKSFILKVILEIGATNSVNLFKSYNKEIKDGEQKRDFLYVKDAVEMTLHLAFNNHKGIYNIGSGRAASFLDVVNAFFKEFYLEPKINFIPMPDNIINQYQYYTCANIDKLRITGYNEPIMTLEEGIRDYIKQIHQ